MQNSCSCNSIFAHAMKAWLSCHMQNCGTMIQVNFEWEHTETSNEFEYSWKINQSLEWCHIGFDNVPNHWWFHCLFNCLSLTLCKGNPQFTNLLLTHLAAAEVWERIIDLIPDFTGHITTYPCNVICVSKRGPGGNGKHFADNIYKSIFLVENAHIFIKVALKFVPECSIRKWESPGSCKGCCMGAIRLQVFTQYDVDRNPWCHMASSGHNELNHIDGLVQERRNSFANALE